ncbi:Uncharacterised protein [Serratia quinivorans]|nr:Uncharacterised protein [Serratia quinivorans]CAI2159073.1 Uncharacterised protein [Serratia quinivorans]
MAVAISAAVALLAHTTSGNIRWKTGASLSIFAIADALIEAKKSKEVNGKYLVLPFALLMLIVAVLILNRLRRTSRPLINRGHQVQP